jgi:large subunit ribosomal protein L24
MFKSGMQMRDNVVGSNLAPNLREQYGKRSLRVIKGDTIKVLRGEYSGIEGKVEKVNTKKATLSIEGVQREKIRGGNVKVPIHSSNVQIVSLKLDDKYRLRITETITKKVKVRIDNAGTAKKSDLAGNNPTNKNTEDSKLDSDKKNKKRIRAKRRTTE